MLGNPRCGTGWQEERAQGPAGRDLANTAEGCGDEPDGEKAALCFEGLGAIQASSFIYFVLSSD